MKTGIMCAKCTKVVCSTEKFRNALDTCPYKMKQDAIKQALSEYEKPEIKEFARQASIQEAECYLRLPEGMTPRHPRVEEVAQFAKKMGYRKLGIAFCDGLREEAKILTDILERRGFDVVSVCCQVGSVPKESIGVQDNQKVNPGRYEPMCNPIAQAVILNDEVTDFNIVFGLCVGHDSLFFKYVQAPTTTLAVKDRVFGHNPVAGLYTSRSYYRKLRRLDELDS